MSVAHGAVLDRLLAFLYDQLDRNEYRIRTSHARLRKSADTYYVPDVVVIPAAFEQILLERPSSLDAYPEALPLVVEIWSPSTGRYDIFQKLPDYQARGDLEIWYIQPYDRTLTAWRKQPDGTYTESISRGGIVRPNSLAGVEVDLALLFAR